MAFGFLVLLGMYFLPTIIALAKQKPNGIAIAALNFFLGWTLIGWVVSLVWALSADRPQQIIHVSQNVAMPPYYHNPQGQPQSYAPPTSAPIQPTYQAPSQPQSDIQNYDLRRPS